MKVFVIGGTGAIGTSAVNALQVAGYNLTVIARTSEKTKALQARGIATESVSIFDTSALSKALKGIDVVVNLSSAIPPMTKFMLTSAWKENTRVRVEGARSISEAAEKAGVGRLIQESVSMIYPDSGSHWIDESVAPERFPMAEPNIAAEASAERFGKGEGKAVVLRFGWFYGPGAKHSLQFLELARHHICVQMGRADGYVSSIYTTDGGAAVVAAIQAPPGTYNVVDDEPLTKREFADALGAASGRSWWLRIPRDAAVLLGNRSTSLTRSLRVSNAKLKESTEWQPKYRSAREGWAALALEQ